MVGLAAADPRISARLTPSPLFGPNPGGLRMWTYAPAGLGRGAPLVVVLHGCGQSAQAFAAGSGWLDLAGRIGLAVLAPEQTRVNNPGRCFNWFEPRDRARGQGEVASIRAMVERACAMHGSDRRRVFATGLSAGGCMVLNLFAAYPEVFAAGAVIAAAPFGVASSLPEAMMAMLSAPADDGPSLAARVRAAAPKGQRWPRLAVWYGAADAAVSPANGPAIAAQWRALHGLPDTPDLTERRGPLQRQAWTGPNGTVLVELDRVEGLGHGAPLASLGAEGLGRPAPYLIEAGVSGAAEIARFFGLGRPEGLASRPPPPLTPRRGLRALWSRLTARRG